MRKVLYISIGISLTVVLATLVHCQWRSHKLRNSSIASLTDSIAGAEDTSVAPPVVSTPTLSVETEVTENPEVPVMDVGSAADYEEAFQKFDQLYDDFQKEVAAFYKEYERSDEILARDTRAKRRSAELQPLLAKAEADAYAAQRDLARARARLRAADLDLPVPAGLDAEIEATLAGENGWERMEAQHGDLKGFLDYLTAKYFPSTSE